MATGKSLGNKLNPRQLHEMYDIYPDKYHLNLIHGYNHTKGHWQFIGYACWYCGQTLKKDKFATTHYKNCKITNLKKNEQKRRTT